jgi:hypothetical protein
LSSVVFWLLRKKECRAKLESALHSLARIFLLMLVTSNRFPRDLKEF